ncbi:efflux RND transporter periplasmic adaptor subunit [Amphibacillus jilinensis]|uniref:efflux RND transporter periplasmic adaptor subunit n=1 Tax=Amphibacillus jilinensis TaxID=1216008 RepID=UPI0002D655E9|nr:efflux RND transporter periplasmic adaptor subunit [Amphibacillus jilinensis]
MRKIIFILVAFVTLLAACSNDDQEQANETERIVTVETDAVTEGDLVVDKQFYGRTSPSETQPVIAPMIGEVDQVHVAEGDQVEEDDLLITYTVMETGMEVELTADVEGQVANLTIREGDILTDEEPALIIVSLDELFIDLDVTAANADLFDVDDEVDIYGRDQEEANVATVDKVSVLPGDTGMFSVTLIAENEHAWKAGAIIEVHIAERTIEDTLLVPTAALNEDGDQAFVYVVKNDHVERIDLDVVMIQSDYTAVEAELEADDQVVISGQLTLDDGMAVNVAGEDAES